MWRTLTGGLPVPVGEAALVFERVPLLVRMEGPWEIQAEAREALSQGLFEY